MLAPLKKLLQLALPISIPLLTQWVMSKLMRSITLNTILQMQKEKFN